MGRKGNERTSRDGRRGDSVPYLDERCVRHGPRRGGDVGGDDAEAEPLERAAQLGNGVPPVAARDAHHQHLIPGARHPHLSNQETPSRGRQCSASAVESKPAIAVWPGRRRGVGVRSPAGRARLVACHHYCSFRELAVAAPRTVNFT